MSSTNLLNRQIMGTYRRHKISLNSTLTEDPQPASADISVSAELPNLTEPPRSPKRKLSSPNQLHVASNLSTPTPSSSNPIKRTKALATISQSSSSPRTTTANTSLIKSGSSNVTLSDLGGIDSTVEKLLELIALPILHPEIFEFTGLKPIRGLLLCGPPGCGKTMLASAISNQLGITLINVSSTSIVSGMSGESEKAIRDIFQQATVSTGLVYMFFIAPVYSSTLTYLRLRFS